MMDHQRIKELLSSYMDGELEDALVKAVENHLEECPECRKEYEDMQQLEGAMSKMAFKSPPKEIWEVYWTSVYNRLERKIGWVLLSLGAMILLFFGGYKLLEGIIRDASMPLLLKAGILLALGGLVVLLVSLTREQVYVRKKERYKEIEK